MVTMSSSSSSLYHLYFTLLLYNIATFIGVPVALDVMMGALCPGQDECSFAIYLAGIQQSIIGIGSVVTMPIIGSLSDHYGRKLFLTISMILGLLPNVILAYNRERTFYLAAIVVETLTNILGSGAVISLGYAYVADIVAEEGRASAFGILSGLTPCSFIFASFIARFLPSVGSVFQVSAVVGIISIIYMTVFLPQSNMGASTSLTGGSSEENATTSESLTKKGCIKKGRPLQPTRPSFRESVSLLTSSRTFLQASIVSFFSGLGELGIDTSYMFYLKARFQFDKDQFSELNVINGITGTTSQMILLPMLTRVVSDERLLVIGLAFNCIYMFLYALAWTSWVPYLAVSLHLVDSMAGPCLRSIVSKQVGATEQGKVQGCLQGLSSLASIISPWIFSPLTALFLSDHAPFQLPGFSLMCAGFLAMIAFIQSMFMKTPPTRPLPISDDSIVDEYDSMEP